MAASRGKRKIFIIAKLIGILTISGVLAAGLLLPYVGGAGLAASKGADKFLNTKCDLKETALAQSTTIYASDGKTIITTLFKDDRRVIPIAAVPKMVQRALIDTEDRRFYEHHGIDTRGLLRAVLNSSDGGETQGGSTLTQQYVKQVRYYQATTDAERAEAIQQTGDRKIYEAKCALELEKKYKKPQILEKYLNIAYFGEQSYGIAVAARNYFNKAPAQLTVPEAAVLVGLVKDPTLYDPFQYPKQARARRDVVIENMVKAGDLTPAQGAAYQKAPLKTASASAPIPAQGCSFSQDSAIKNVGFFCDYVVNWLTTTGGLSADKLSSGGYKIITSIDPKLQNQAEAALTASFPASSPSTVIQPAVDPQTGEIKAMVTSKLYDYQEAHKNDPRYTSYPIFSAAFAGSGSTYKYFALIAALTAGMKPDNQLTTAGSGKYATKNCGRDNSVPSNLIGNAGSGYPATMTLRNATVQSSNTFFVGLEDQLFGCDMSTIVNTAVSLGMTSLKVADASGRVPADAVIRDRSYTFTLGQESTSALELAVAYGVSAADGKKCAPKPVLSITDTAGKPVAFKQATCAQVISPWVARTAIDIMKGDTTNGTASSQFSNGFYNHVSLNDHYVSGKTGTNNGTDASGNDDGTNSAIWFVGLTPRLVATSAIVNVDKPTKTITGLPGYSDGYARTEAFGAISAQYWIASFGPTIAATPWFWPLASEAGVPVPSVVGRTETDAIQTITAAGFKPVKYPIECGGRNIPGTVNLSGPDYAQPGSAVYYCLSNGQPLVTAPRPRPTPSKSPTAGGPSTPGGTSTPGGGPTTSRGRGPTAGGTPRR